MAAGTQAPAEDTASRGGGLGNKVVLALSAVNLLATGGMLAVLVISFQRDKQHPSVEDMSVHAANESEGEKEKEKEKGEGEGGHEKETPKKNLTFGKMVTLEQFTVNLSTPGSVSAKYVRVNVSLEVPTEDTEAEINSKMPQVRNAIIDLFNSKRPADLANADGREFLKDEIKNALNSFLVSGKVKGVFFTSFALAG